MLLSLAGVVLEFLDSSLKASRVVPRPVLERQECVLVLTFSLNNNQMRHFGENLCRKLTMICCYWTTLLTPGLGLIAMTLTECWQVLG